MSDWNDTIITEFRQNEGVVQQFAPAYLVLLHHVGRSSGAEYVAPVVYFPAGEGGDDLSTVHVVASAAGAPANPQWYENLVAAGRGIVEIGTPQGIQSWEVSVEDLAGEQRDQVFAGITAKAPGFADYEAKAAPRVIPVLALHRVGG